MINSAALQADTRAEVCPCMTDPRQAKPGQPSALEPWAPVAEAPDVSLGDIVYSITCYVFGVVLVTHMHDPYRILWCITCYDSP